MQLYILPFSVADPGSGAFLTPGSGMRDENPGSYFLDFLVKTLKFFDANADPGYGNLLTIDPGSGKEKIRMRMRNPHH